MVSPFSASGSGTPVEDREDSLPVNPESLREGVTPPLFVSEFTGFEAGRAELLLGATALGFNTVTKPLLPQQYILADALNALNPTTGRPLHSINGVCVPRRASKTTTLFMLAIGRCMSREDYQAAYTAQSGTKARTRFLEIVQKLERQYPDPDTRPFKVNRSRGGEFIRFTETGSLLAILPPIPESFRGDSWDFVIADESQEHDAELSTELLQAISPTFLTRPDAQLVAAGTAGEVRAGLLWDTLEKGRQGLAGIVEWAAPDSTPQHQGEEDELTEGTTEDREVWARAYPMGDFISMEALEAQRATIDAKEFSREFLGIWPAGNSVNFIPIEKWDQARLTELAEKAPKRFALAFSVHKSGSSASIAAAWRDDKGVAHIGLLDHRKGANWVPSRLLNLAEKYRVDVVYDAGFGTTSVEVEALQRSTPRPHLAPQTWPNVSTAAALFMKEIENGNLRHYDQPGMNEAVLATVKRGTPNSSRWALGPRQPALDITPLEAASLALRVYDEESTRPDWGSPDSSITFSL